MDSNVLISRKEVTAVKFYKNYILAGIGSVVNVFEKGSGHLVEAFNVLEAANISGFVVSQCGQKVLVYGNKQYNVLSLDTDRKTATTLEQDRVLRCEDWIQHAVWMSDCDIALLTSHNTVNYVNLITEEVERNESEVNSLLYSGLLLPVGAWLIVMAGTVFSQIIIRWSHNFGLEDNAKILHRLTGHRGVIFSISCDPHKGLIVSTSDDRSVRIWHMRNPSNHSTDTVEFWENITIECTAEVYGHTARVMRNVIVNDLVISGGEDASLCYWRDGQLARKVPAHQTATIWCMDSDGKYLVTGGGDGAIILHPLTVASDYGHKQLLDIHRKQFRRNKLSNIKFVCFTSRKNIVLLDAEQLRANSDLIYYDTESKYQLVFKLSHKSTYNMFAVSDCKRLVAVADMLGKLDVFSEPCRDEELIKKFIDTKLNIGKIGSMHFAGSRHLVLCGTGGKITVLTVGADDVVTYADFLLPPCKERWLTSCAMDPVHQIIIVADRCGGVHIYSKDTCLPVKTFDKVHGRYGSTSLTIRNDTLISTGRDGTIKYFAIDRENLNSCRYLSGRELDFNWVERFLTNDLRLVCGFQESTFVVYNMQTNTKIIQTVCGGGHRSYDAMCHFQQVDGNNEPFVRLVYVKSTNIYLIDFRLNFIESKIIRNGTHSKTINSLAVFSVKGIPMSFYVSGGEDTTLRVSSVDKLFHFEDRFIFKHLSNVRTVKVVPFEEDFLLFSAGGRAQISVNKIHITYPGTPDDPDQRVPKIRSELLKSFWFKGSDAEKKIFKRRSQKIDFDPEMRIMDLDLIGYGRLRYFVFVGCSDGCLRIFKFYTDATQSGEFVLLKEVVIPEAGCVLKVCCIELYSNLHMVVACMSTGLVIIWNVLYEEDDFEDIYIRECFVDQPHRAGINSLAHKVVKDHLVLLATGGDDNRIVLTLLDVRGKDRINYVEKEFQWNSDAYHSSQITGLVFYSEQLLLSASIDQRVTVLNWKVTEDNIVKCFYVDQICSDISDVQGMAVVEYKSTVAMAVCVYGRGLEVRVIRVPACALAPVASARARPR